MLKSAKVKDKNQNIQVYVRCRPQNVLEKRQNSYCAVEVVPDKREIVVHEKPTDKVHTKSFFFDRVFEPTVKQVDVYRAVVGPLLEEVLTGYNCTVFAYGQTGTGKTFTMEGERSSDAVISWEEDPQAGIIPRTLHQLFDELKSSNVEYSVRVSFLELYNEELFDLLGPCDDASKLRLYEDTTRKGSVIIQGLTEVVVHSKDEVYAILEKGAIKRQTAATLMNSNSSRSHTVFSVTVHIKENSLDSEDLVKTGKLNLVDLAGSENIGRSGAVDKRAREAGNINQSLLTLGRVITSLVERAPHIPYRESKLTRLLQDSLGGRTKTSIIATISPASINLEETLSTLDYAHRAKNITNRPEINQKLTKKTLMKEYTEEIERLRRDLQAAREKNGIYLDTDHYNDIISKIECQDEQLQDTVGNIEALKDEIQKLKSLFEDANQELNIRTLQLESTSHDLETTRDTLKTTRETLTDAARDRDEHRHLMNAHANTERKLASQMHQMIEVADDATADVAGLHAKLDRKRAVDDTNERLLADFHKASRDTFTQMESRIMHFGQEQSTLYAHCDAELRRHLEQRTTEMAALRAVVTVALDDVIGQFGALDNVHSRNTQAQISMNQKIMQASKMSKKKVVASRNDFDRNQLRPLMTMILDYMHQQGECVIQMKRALDSKLSIQQTLLANFVNDELASINNHYDLMNGHATRLIQCLNTSRDVVVGIESAQTSANKEMEDKFETMKALIASMETTFGTHRASIDESCRKFHENDESGITSAGKMVVDVEDHKIVARYAVTGFKEKHDAGTVQLMADLNESVTKVMKLNDNTRDSQTQLETEWAAFGDKEKMHWKKHIEQLEESLKEHSQSISSHLQEHLTQSESIKSSFRQHVDTEKALLDDHQANIGGYVLRQCERLIAHNSSVADCTQKLSKDVKVCDQRIEKTLAEDLCVDVATGTTPQRREFSYPHVVVQTSPADRILQRFRSTVKSAIALPSPIDDDVDAGISPLTSSGSSSELRDTSSTSIASDVVSSDKSDSEFKENSLGIISSALQQKGTKKKAAGTKHRNAVSRNPLKSANECG